MQQKIKRCNYIYTMRFGTFERLDVSLKNFKELVVSLREIVKKVCISGILPTLGKNEWWGSNVLGRNERMQMVFQNMDCSYLDIWGDFIEF